MLQSRISTNRTEPPCANCAAGQRGFCADLDGESASCLAARSLRRSHAAGDELIAQGAAADRIGILARGLVKIGQLTEEGDEHVLQILGPGEIVGEIGGEEASCFWVAATDVDLCWISRATLARLAREAPRSHVAILAALSRQLGDMRQWSAAMRGRTTLERIAYWLLRQRVASGRTAPRSIDMALSRRDLASFLDMTAETLCRGLSQLCAGGAIRLGPSDAVELVDIARLRRFARCGTQEALQGAEAVAGPARRVGRS